MHTWLCVDIESGHVAWSAGIFLSLDIFPASPSEYVNKDFNNASVNKMLTPRDGIQDEIFQRPTSKSRKYHLATYSLIIKHL